MVVPSLGALPETTAGYARVYLPNSDANEHATTFSEALGAELARPWAGEPELSLDQQRYCVGAYDWQQRLREWRQLMQWACHAINRGVTVAHASVSPSLPAIEASKNAAHPVPAVSHGEGEQPSTIKDREVHRPCIFVMISTTSSLFYTRQAIASFFRCTEIGKSDQFLLIANDHDASEFRTDHRLEIVEHEAPKSFAANVNFGLRLAQSSNADFMLLNNDVIFTDGWLAPLLKHSNAITLPMCNQNYQYIEGGIELHFSMD